MSDDQVLRELYISKRINEAYGNLTSCSKCKGKGYIDTVDAKGYHRSVDCECKPRGEKK